MKSKALLLAGALLAAPLAAEAAAEVGVKGVFWFPALSGDFTISDVVVGQRVRASGEVEDVADDETAFVGELFLKLGAHRLAAGGTRFDYSGDRGSLEYTMLDFTYQWDAIDLENVLAGFSFGPVLQVKYVEGDVEFRPLGTQLVTLAENFEAAVPMIGLGLHLGILADLLEARARAAWVGYRGNSILDAFAELSYNPLPFVELVGGYRHLALDLDVGDFVAGDGDLVLDFAQSGPYVGAALKIGF
jgi:hypothetical protein